MDVRRMGLTAVAAGAGAQVAGLALDAWLHANDGLGQDGVLSLENLGHLLFVGGLVAVVAGAALALVGPRLYRSRPDAGPAVRLVQFGAPALTVLVLLGGLMGASSSSLTASASAAAGTAGDGHDHTHTDATPARCDLDLNPASYYREAVAAGIDLTGPSAHHDHGTPSTALAALGQGETAGGSSPTTVAADQGHSHKGPQAWTPLTDQATCSQLHDEVRRAAAVATRYPTAADAQAAGYVQVTTYIPEIAAHWMKFANVDRRFDVDNPEMLLYDGNGLDAHIVGLSYYIMGSADTPPTQGFAGGNTEYHRHVGLCVKGTLVVGGEGTTPEECFAEGGVKTNGSDAWMAHAWVVPGCESPWGVFSAANPKLTPELGKASGQGAPCSGSGTSYDDTPGVPPELQKLLTPS